MSDAYARSIFDPANWPEWELDEHVKMTKGTWIIFTRGPLTATGMTPKDTLRVMPGTLAQVIGMEKADYGPDNGGVRVHYYTLIDKRYGVSAIPGYYRVASAVERLARET